MRRHTLILALAIALLGLAGTATAQSYPPELAGQEVSGIYQNLMFSTKELFQVPWSMPTPPYDFGWLTNVYAPELPPMFQPTRVEVVCLADVYTGDCWLPPQNPQIVTYPWNPEMAAYAITNMHPTGHMEIDAYTWKIDSWYHYYGMLEYTGSPPQWWDWGWYIYDVSEHIRPYHQQCEPATE